MESIEIAERITVSTYDSYVDETRELIDVFGNEWRIGVKLGIWQNGTHYQMLIYNHSCGILEKLVSDSTKLDSIRNETVVKYREVGKMIEVAPVKIYANNKSLATISYKYNKTIRVKCTAVVGSRATNSEDVVFWTDLVGDVRITANAIKKISTNDGHMIKPLQLYLLVLQTECQFVHGVKPNWRITSAIRMLETGKTTIPYQFWPARCVRFDDLILKKQNEEVVFYRSIELSHVLVQATRTLVDASSLLNSKQIVFTAIAFPVFKNDELVCYEALMLGSKEDVMTSSEERLLHYKPKTFHPELVHHRREMMEIKKDMDRAASTMRKRPGFTFSS